MIFNILITEKDFNTENYEALTVVFLYFTFLLFQMVVFVLVIIIIIIIVNLYVKFEIQ